MNAPAIVAKNGSFLQARAAIRPASTSPVPPLVIPGFPPSITRHSPGTQYFSSHAPPLQATSVSPFRSTIHLYCFANHLTLSSSDHLKRSEARGGVPF